MKIAFPFLCLFALLAVYIVFSSSPEDNSVEISETDLMADQVKTADSTRSKQALPEIAKQESEKAEVVVDISEHKVDKNTDTELENAIEEDSTEESSEVTESEDIHYSLKIDESTHHLIQGGASADIGDIGFKSKLLPSNEVELTINLKQETNDDIELTAYFDLANYTMELDGKKSVLNKDHKRLLKLSSSQLQSEIESQYEGYDYPDHALMLTQMLAYWSISPEGYVHEKRTIVSQ